MGTQGSEVSIIGLYEEWKKGEAETQGIKRSVLQTGHGVDMKN